MASHHEGPAPAAGTHPAAGASLLAQMALPYLAANVFVFLVVGVSLFESRQQYERLAVQSTQNLAQALEVNVTSVLDETSVGIAAVAVEAERELAAGHLQMDTIESYVRGQREQMPQLDGIRLVDDAGNVLVGVPGAKGPVNVADREYFQRARSARPGQTILSHPIVSRMTGRWEVALARAVRHPDGRFAGLAMGVLPLQHFARLFAPLDVGPHGVLAIRESDMALLARKPEDADPKYSVGSTAVAATALENIGRQPDAGNYTAAAQIDHIERCMAYRRSPNWDLYVMVGEATGDYLAPWWHEVATLCALALLFSAASSLSARASYHSRRAEMMAARNLQIGKEQVERSEIRLRTLYDSMRDAVVLLGPRGFIDCNPAALELFGITDKETLRSTHAADISPRTQPCGTDSRVLADRYVAEGFEKGVLRFEWLFKRPDNGAIVTTDVMFTRMVLDGVPVIQAEVRDITERKNAEEQIRYLAYFDALTKLPNRRLLMDRLAQALLASRRSRQYGVLMILDLDNFKTLNDTRGHDVGDHLLVEVADRIVACVRQEDTVARLGGDEYVVLAEGLGEDEVSAAGQAEQIAAKICRIVSLAHFGPAMGHQGGPKGGEPHHTTASIGVTLFGGNSGNSGNSGNGGVGVDGAHDSASIDVMLKQADLALYQAKAAGRNAVRFFNPQMQSAIDARTRIEAALRNALRLGEFALHFQPQFDRAGRLTGAEALLRWLPLDREPISPIEFIPVAEETGLIIPIGLWVLQAACAQLRAWADDPRARDLKIAVNVSPRQFRQTDFVEQVRACVERAGADPARLKLELTEGVVLENIDEVIERMQRLRALGVTFSLDDFGTGFSSLSHLKRLPLDEVKIDQTFVRDVVADPNDAAIVRAIVAMSRSLGLHVIAEGVEVQEQLDFLMDCGCAHYQGYLFGRPLPIEQWEPLLSAQRLHEPAMNDA